MRRKREGMRGEDGSERKGGRRERGERVALLLGPGS